MSSVLKQGEYVIETYELSNKDCERKTKLRQLVLSVLDDPLHQQHLNFLMQSFGLNKEDVIDAYFAYNYNIYSFGNEIYNSIANRIVLHIHNLLKGSWHTERQKIITNMISEINPNTLIDIGFGVPTQYIKDITLRNRTPLTTLCDLYDTAFQFSTALLSQWDKSWQEVITYKRIDMQNVSGIGDYDLYLFQDSIEHVNDPTDCMKKYVKTSPKSSTFILSLPIGPLIPVHFIEWGNDQEAFNWLNECGLKIKQSQKVWVNPAVDLFADPLGNDHHNLIVLCTN